MAAVTGAGAAVEAPRRRWYARGMAGPARAAVAAMVCCTLVGAAASAQPDDDSPADPYADPGARLPPVQATPPTPDQIVAQALVERATQLVEAGFTAEASQLASEALVRQADGPTADAARALLARIRPPAPPASIEQDRLIPPDPAPQVVDPEEPGGRVDRPRTSHALGLHLGLYGATVGAALSIGDGNSAAIPVGALGLGLGYLGGRWAHRRFAMSPARSRYVGSIINWSALAGGMFADLTTGTDGTTASDVLVGASLTGGLAAIFAGPLTRDTEVTTGDVAVIDSFAAWGAVGGLTLGFVMVPAESEAYTLNALLGAAGGWMVGRQVARRTELSSARMSRVLGAGLIGAATPWALYPLVSDSGSYHDEQVFGFLSTAGLVGGIYLGFRVTRGMADEPSPDDDDEAGVTALLRRSAVGRWRVGAGLPRPLAAAGLGLDGGTGGRGLALDLAAGRF